MAFLFNKVLMDKMATLLFQYYSVLATILLLHRAKINYLRFLNISFKYLACKPFCKICDKPLSKVVFILSENKNENVQRMHNAFDWFVSQSISKAYKSFGKYRGKLFYEHF